MWPALAVFGASAISAGAGMYGASKSGGKPPRWAMQYDIENKQPYLNAGAAGLRALRKGPPEFRPEDDPGYVFGFNELIKPYLRGQAAGGRFGSGETMKALTKFGSDYASTKYQQHYDNWLNRALPLAQMGQATAVGAGALPANIAQRRGQADATRGVNMANVISSGVTNLADNWLTMRELGNRGSIFDDGFNSRLRGGFNSADLKNIRSAPSSPYSWMDKVSWRR